MILIEVKDRDELVSDITITDDFKQIYAKQQEIHYKWKFSEMNRIRIKLFINGQRVEGIYQLPGNIDKVVSSPYNITDTKGFQSVTYKTTENDYISISYKTVGKHNTSLPVIGPFERELEKSPE